MGINIFMISKYSAVDVTSQLVKIAANANVPQATPVLALIQLLNFMIALASIPMIVGVAQFQAISL